MNTRLATLLVLIASCTAAAQPSAIREGEELFVVGRYEQALEKLRAVAAPDSETWFLIGRCQFELKRYAEAAAAFANVLKADAQHPDAQVWLAEAQGLGGDWKTAAERLGALAKMQPNNLVIAAALARAYARLERFDDALKLYERVQQAGSHDPVVSAEAGAIHLRIGRFADAEKAFTVVTKLAPAAVSAWEGLAAAQEKQQRLPQAAASYGRVAMLAPTEAAWRRAGDLYAAAGNWTAARDAYEKAIAFPKANSAELFQSLVRSYEETKQLEAGLAVIEKLAGKDPANLSAQNAAGYLSAKLGRWDSAAAAYEKALQAQPDSRETLQALGTAYVRLKKWPQAVEILKKAGNDRELASAAFEAGDCATALEAYTRLSGAAALDPDSRFNVATCHIKLEQWDEALKSFQAVVASRPEHADSWRGIAEAYVQKKQFEEALQALEKSLQLAPESPDLIIAAAALYQRMGRWEQARDRYQQALRSRPEDAEMHVAAGDVLMQLKDVETAISMYRIAVQLKADTPGAHARLAKAYFEAKQFDDSVAAYQRELELQPHAADVHFNLGVAFLRAGNREGCRAQVAKLRELNPAYADKLSPGCR